MRTHRLSREDEATLVEHLEELRRRVLTALAAVAVGTAVAFVFHNRILDLLARPLPPDHRPVAAFSVTEPFSVSLTVSLYAGILLALPVILSQLWSFLAPAVDAAAERQILGFALFGGARVRLHRLASPGRPLAHQLRQRSFPSPGAGEQLLLVHRLGARGRRVRIRAAARRGRARPARRAHLGGAAEEPPQGLLHRRHHRARPAGARSRDDAARAAADVGAVRGLDLARGARRAAGCKTFARGDAGMTRQEWTRLGGLSAAVLFLHVLGFGLFFYYLPGHPELAGLATLAYTFGLRHAFDADHIAAIDNTTRKLLQDGKR